MGLVTHCAMSFPSADSAHKLSAAVQEALDVAEAAADTAPALQTQVHRPAELALADCAQPVLLISCSSHEAQP